MNLRDRGDPTAAEGAEITCGNRPRKNLQLFGCNIFVECKIMWYLYENFK